MTTPPPPPFSSRTNGRHQQIDSDFPSSAKIGLQHLLLDLIERDYVAGWIVVARELHRIARLPVLKYKNSSVSNIEQAQADAECALESLGWAKVFDFCERLYEHLANEIKFEDSYGNVTVQVAKSDSQAYIATELQRLFLEESLAYEFTDGTVRRRGRKHTVDQISKSQVVLGDPQLLGARKHFDKALQFFRNPNNPDYENTVKEAVCAVEAAAKSLFPRAKASTLGDVIKWFGTTKDVSVPKAICQNLTGIYAIRNGGDGVSHGGATGGKMTVEVAEYVLSICASQIIYFVDLSNGLETDVPF